VSGHGRTRRRFLQGAAALAAAPAWRARSAQLPVTGKSQPETEPLDAAMAAFMARTGAPGATLAITRRGRLVYARGFGWSDPEATVPAQPDGLFRIASVSKSLTATAVLQLAERGKLSLERPVTEALGLAGAQDDRWQRITPLQLLRHGGGWRHGDADPMFASAQIAQALGVALPLAPEHLLDYMLRQPLQFDPGTRYAYSNFGYFLLGRLIETASGQPYGEYVRARVLAPLGIRGMVLGRSALEGRQPGEARYRSSRRSRSVVAPVGREVPDPYGAWPLELMAANGGWLASAVQLARFACAFDDAQASPLLAPRSLALMHERPAGDPGIVVRGNHPGCGWFVWPPGAHAHRAQATSTGLLEGTAAYLMRRSDGINWAVLFNAHLDTDGKLLMLRFRDESSAWFDAIRAWPEHDQFPGLLR
jgi:CubicO group peptidase (beta-lactamase class C family)